MNILAYSQLNVIKYCARECKRQHSGEESVYDMVNAWNYTQIWWDTPLIPSMIARIGRLVEPQDNRNGFRKIPVYVGNISLGYIEKAPWERVPELLKLLLEDYYDPDLDWMNERMPPSHELSKTREDQFYFDFENIHPFVDGNGRVGKILYNYLCGTLENPILPPNFWGSSNL